MLPRCPLLSQSQLSNFSLYIIKCVVPEYIHNIAPPPNEGTLTPPTPQRVHVGGVNVLLR